MAPTASDAMRAQTSTTVAALDASLRLTPPRRWLTAVFLALLVLAVWAWAVFGKAPVTAQGSGAMIPPTGFYQIAAATTGTVTEFNAEAGAIVKKGARIATVTQPNGSQTVLLAPTNGEVVLGGRALGSFVLPGETIGIMLPFGEDVAPPSSPGKAPVIKTVLGFFTVPVAANLKPGMAAEFQPLSAPPAAYGSIKATVKEIEKLPISATGLGYLTGDNDALARDLTSGGRTVQVQFSLALDPTTPSGYAWTFGEGPQSSILPGEQATVVVQVSEKSPISYLGSMTPANRRDHQVPFFDIPRPRS